MSSRIPRVSIGLPVYNGENFLKEALDSILSQTFEDFELIISDNASTDRTEEICKDYEAKDIRIRYYRNKKNLGAVKNLNRLFELSRGEYFKWAAHDDICAPEFLKRCVEVLDHDSSVVLCYTSLKFIDEFGKHFRTLATKPKLGSPKPQERFYECVCVSHPQAPVFGVIRSNVLKKTRVFGNFFSSDRILLGELSLHGRLYEIPEYLFFLRRHPQQHYRKYPILHERHAWYDPSKIGHITFPQWRLLLEHFISIRSVPMCWYERSWCYVYLLWWIRKSWRMLALNLILK